MSNIDDYKPGMIVYGRVSGIQPYGAFVSFVDGVNGLIHISELSNGFVKDVNKFVNINDYVMVKVIDVDKDTKQLRLSFKAINQNVRKQRKKTKFSGMPNDILGFSSIAKQMNTWIKEKEYD